MQGAKTSKIMLPWWRRVHLHESTSFKMIFEKYLTTHKNATKMDPTTIEQLNSKTIQTTMRKSI